MNDSQFSFEAPIVKPTHETDHNCLKGLSNSDWFQTRTKTMLTKTLSSHPINTNILEHLSHSIECTHEDSRCKSQSGSTNLHNFNPQLW